MNTGLQDAYNLAWKLALDIRGNGEERIVVIPVNEESTSCH
jgi:2-polyprenyl-6-methoxyphenol hydroxylase-like FAD-dependent oxidoreductase